MDRSSEGSCGLTCVGKEASASCCNRRGQAPTTLCKIRDCKTTRAGKFGRRKNDIFRQFIDFTITPCNGIHSFGKPEQAAPPKPK